MAKTADTIAIYPPSPAIPARAKVSEIRSTSAANISALTTAMLPREHAVVFEDEGFPAAT